MKPKFSAVTQVLAAGFILAGLGEALAALHASRLPATASASSDQMTTFVLAIGLIATGFCMWAEYVWAWWTGLAVAVFIVATSATLARDVQWIPWSVVVVGFVISLGQGWFENMRARRQPTSVEPFARH
jgi:hypothetical protein